MFISSNPPAASVLTPISRDMTVSKGPAAGESAKSDKAQEAIRKFEGLFMSMMIKHLRESGSGEGLFPGDASDTYGGMFDMYLGDELASSGSIGIGQLFKSSTAMRQLEDYATPKSGLTATERSRGFEDYRNEQLRSGAVAALPAP